MINLNKIQKKIDEINKEIELGNKKTISYSQFSVYKNCAFQWFNDYVLKGGKQPSNISLFGGTSFHEFLQEYLTIMYSDGVKKANEINPNDFFFNRLVENYKEEAEKWGKNFVKQEEIEEYYEDGIAIIETVLKDRSQHFPIKKHKLVGIEIPILQKVNDIVDIYMKGFIDLVLYDEENDKILIFDIKTSSKGWNKWKKESDTTKAQVLFYKHFFAKQFDIPIDKIEVQFFIVKRKIDENSLYKQSRIQVFKPASGTTSVKNAMTHLDSFIHNVFDDEGNYNGEEQLAHPSKYTCTFCQFKDICEPYKIVSPTF